ncbi:MAG: 5'/3'-nucleotidase SurE [Armatimonadota bacterium]
MEILLTNDDGVRAPGLHVMAEILRRIGRVVVCSPDRERSACGHSMTLRDPLRATPVKGFPVGVETYEVNGVPVDCVNLALHEFFPNGCDLVVSGINAGPNLGWDVTYSGTVGGALEGAVNCIRSIAVSVAVFVEEAPPNLETARLWFEEHLPWLLAAPQPKHTIFNVNIPSIAYAELRGTRITRMGTRIYQERVERREDPFGRPYWWQGGVVVMDSSEEGTDVQAVNEGFVSVTPVRLDWTAHELLTTLRESLKKEK